MYRIPVYKPFITDREKSYVNDCLESSWISSKGKYVDLFEHMFKEFVGVKHATTVSNGSVALQLAVESLGLPEGSEIIVPTLTYVASVNCIKHLGHTPVFADSLPDTWQIDPDDILRKITNKTKAILIVHLYGQSCDMSKILKIARSNGLRIIEDCAEAFGTYFNDKHVGTFGDVATFSFFGNKTITTGEGGMVVTNNDDVYNRCFRLKTQGLVDGAEYWHDIAGYNYRLTNVACAIGVAQIERANQILKRKREIAEFYKESFKGSRYVFHEEVRGTVHSYWMCSIAIHEDGFHASDRDLLRSHLKNYGIETRPVFYPVGTMPMYSGQPACPVAESISARGINLPSFPELSDGELNLIVSSVLRYNVA